MKLIFFSLVCLALAPAPPALSQDDVAFRSGVSLIRLDVQVVYKGGARNGQTAAGLTKDDFRVLDGGQQQKIVSFNSADEPLDLMLLFDTSAGMKSKLLDVVRATQLGFGELRRGDRVCVRAFSGVSEEIETFTENLDAVNQAILLRTITLRFGGPSRLPEAAREAALRFRPEPHSQRKRAILIVTGKPAGSTGNQRSVVQDLWNSDAILSELIVEPGNLRQASVPVDVLVSETGGAATTAVPPGPGFRDAVHYLRSGYTIYYAIPDSVPGQEHSVRVELNPTSESRLPPVSIRVRSGYLAPTRQH